jgi:HSP20 family protein
MSDGLTRWEPLRDLVTLREAMDRLFTESFVRPGAAFPSVSMEGPAVDMYQTKDDIVVKAAIPGVKPEDIDIAVTGDILTIKGELKEEEKVEEGNYLRQERRYGQFMREFALPTQVNADKAKAEFEHGVLTLRLPKAEEVKPKSIRVKAK